MCSLVFLPFGRIHSRTSSATGGMTSSESDESDDADSVELASGCICGVMPGCFCCFTSGEVTSSG
eukprot:2607127-Heterocapsa_arctica.AAC.1